MTAPQLHRDRGNARLKFLDRYVGIPAVEALGGLRTVRGRRRLPASWRRIGLLKTAGIGDTVLLSGVIADVRAARPDAEIILFVTANNAGFAALLDDVDEMVVLPVRQVPTAIKAVRARGCEVMVDFGAWPRLDALLSASSGAACTVGMRTRGQHRHTAYDVIVDHGSGHELDNFRNLVERVGIPTRHEPRIERGAEGSAPLDSPYTVFHLWPGGSNYDERSWSRDRWSALARSLSEGGTEIVLTGGPEDADASAVLAQSWRDRGIPARSVAGIPPEDTVAWLRHALGVVSVNTGVMHLAAAVGAPVVALNGPTSSRRWGPIGVHTRCVVSPMVPEGYLDLGFERDDRYRDCMQAITVDAVLAAWDDLMVEVDARAS
jgi:ADP-heptose:LPS heptosyltransferase